ncbi:hypothetical protein ACIBHY_51100 [Nonomuraea sp. NPDC050547]|uniref:hypothetical protein n=1 Tax=Nonomuraea sp. NPDC050547 TaxID=3364368 RepID=UPI0037B5172F
MDPDEPDILGTPGYDFRAHQLWRWTDSPCDAAIRAALDTGLTSARLSLDDFYVLITFARRCTLAAARTADPSHVRYAYAALATLDLKRVDWRDGTWAANLVTWAAQRLGLDAPALAATAAEHASPETGEVLVRSTTQHVDISADWGYLPWQTPGGLVLLSTEHEPYSPDADLAAVGIAMAVELENAGYLVGEVTVGSDLPAVWVDDREKLTKKLAGCAYLRGEQSGVDDGVLVFFAEARGPSRARAIVAAAGAYEHALAFAEGKIATILIAQPGHTLPLIHFEPALRRALESA